MNRLFAARTAGAALTAVGSAVFFLSVPAVAAAGPAASSAGSVVSSAATSPTPWVGNGADNLPCTGGSLHWIFTGKAAPTPVLTVNGVDYAMTQNGRGSWYADTPGYASNPSAYVTWTSLDKGGRPELTISHCTPGTTPTETTPTETEPTETQPTETQPTETEPTETQPTETEPTETQPTETLPTVTEPTETQPTETEPTETQPTETLPTVTEPTETQPTETEPTETEPTETLPTETSSVPSSAAPTSSAAPGTSTDHSPGTGPSEQEPAKGGTPDAALPTDFAAGVEGAAAASSGSPSDGSRSPLALAGVAAGLGMAGAGLTALLRHRPPRAE